MTEPEPTDRVDEILAGWGERRARGDTEDPASLLAAHPEAARDLEGPVAAMRCVEAAFGRLGGGAPPPERIGDLVILGEIGRGAMGIVYEAEQPSLHRRLAVKVLDPAVTNEPRAVVRFQREAAAAAQIRHENVVAVHQMGQDAGVWHYTMDRVSGRGFDRVLEDLRGLGRPPRAEDLLGEPARRTTPPGPSDADAGYFRRLASLFAGAARGLAAGHAHGIVHRDVKPGNLILADDGRLMVLDFGLARLGDGLSDVTGTADRVGTPRYMSPEQVVGRREEVGPAADVYGLGATLYEALTLKPPFEEEDIPALFQAIVSRDAPPPRRFDRRVPRDLEAVTLKALEKDVARRYATAESFAEDLEAFARGTPVRARRVGPAGRAWRWARRSRARATLVAGLVVAIVSSAVLLESRERERGGREASESARLGLEYESLLARAARESIRDHGRDESAPQPSRDLYAQAIALAPRRPEAWFDRALSRDEPLERRLEHVAAALDRGFSPRAGHLYRASLLLAAGRKDEGQAEEAEALRHAEDHPACHLAAGMIAWARGDLSAAEASLTRALGAAPVASKVAHVARRARSRVRSDMGHAEEALQDLDALEEMGDLASDIEVEMGHLWRSLGREDRAESLFDRVFAVYVQGSTEFQWGEICTVCSEAQEPAWALRLAVAGLGEHPASWRILAARGRALLATGEPQEGFRAAERAAAAAPGEHEPLCVLAAAHAALGHVAEGLDTARRALEKDPTCWSGRLTLGRLLSQSGKATEAVEVLRAVSAERPQDVLAQSIFLEALLAAGRPEESVSAATDALRRRPDFPAARFVRGTALSALDRLDEAEADLKAATQGAHEDVSRAWSTLGRVLERRGRVDDALAAFREATRVEDAAPAAWDDLSRALVRVGRPAEAVDAADRAVTLAPKDPDALEARATARFATGREVGGIEDLAAAVAVLEAGGAGETPRSRALKDVIAAHHAAEDARAPVAPPAAERDARMRAELERIRGERADTWQFANAAAAYREAFRSYGVDVPTLPVEESVRRVKASALVDDLVVALDEWRTAAGPKGEGVDVLRAVALGAEPDPWRRRLREAKGAEDLRPLAAGADVANARIETLVRLADALGFAGAVEEAASLAARLAQAHPHDFWSQFTAGLWHAALKPPKAEEAERYYRAAIETRPTSVAPLQNLAHLLELRGDREAALQAYRKATTVQPAFGPAHDGLGAALLAQGDLDGAERELREAVRCGPEDPSTREHMASLLERRGDRAGAAREWREAVRLSPQAARLHGRLGAALLRSGHPEEAIGELRRALEIEPAEGRRHLDLGNALLQRGDLVGATASLRSAVRLSPNDADAHMALAGALQAAGDVDGALRSVDDALRLRPEFAGAFNLRGACYLAMVEVASARKAFEEATRLMPQSVGYLGNLARALKREGRFRDALDVWKRAHEIAQRTNEKRFPTADWVAEGERTLYTDRKLAEVMRGAETPGTPAETSELAGLAYIKGEAATAVRLYAEAFKADPALEEQDHVRLDAACAAVLAAEGRAPSTPLPAAEPAARLRAQALEWLRKELPSMETESATDPKGTRWILTIWTRTPELAAVRGDGIARLPGSEQGDWRALWARVDAFAARLAPPPAPPSTTPK